MSRQSKFLSFILRHKPEEVGLTLDAAGWVPIDLLLSALKKAGRPMSQQELEALVASNDKKRFTISGDGAFIRAAQGHSIHVKLGLSPLVPPEALYHGTARQNLDRIFMDGLKPMGRQHVHLSASPSDAQQVGRRHGKPVVLQVPALQMHEAGHAFYVSDNGVWLVNNVPAHFIIFWMEDHK